MTPKRGASTGGEAARSGVCTSRRGPGCEGYFRWSAPTPTIPYDSGASALRTIIALCLIPQTFVRNTAKNPTLSGYSAELCPNALLGNYTQWVIRRFRNQERPSRNWPSWPMPAAARPAGLACPQEVLGSNPGAPSKQVRGAGNRQNVRHPTLFVISRRTSYHGIAGPASAAKDHRPPSRRR